jgi:hypothetical protein
VKHIHRLVLGLGGHFGVMSDPVNVNNIEQKTKESGALQFIATPLVHFVFDRESIGVTGVSRLGHCALMWFMRIELAH